MGHIKTTVTITALNTYPISPWDKPVTKAKYNLPATVVFTVPVTQQMICGTFQQVSYTEVAAHELAQETNELTHRMMQSCFFSQKMIPQKICVVVCCNSFISHLWLSYHVFVLTFWPTCFLPIAADQWRNDASGRKKKSSCYGMKRYYQAQTNSSKYWNIVFVW